MTEWGWFADLADSSENPRPPERTARPLRTVGPWWHSRSMDELTDTQKAMLDLERGWWKYAGAKEAAIRERFDISATRYYQLLNTLIDEPAAWEHSPMVVKRLRALRDGRRARRTRTS